MGIIIDAAIAFTQVKLRLRKRNKNITLESIDKYNKNKLLRLFSDCYIDMEILEVYPGEIDDKGEPTNSSQYMDWRYAHPDDIPNNFNNLVYNLIINDIYPKLRYIYNYEHGHFDVISFLSNFCTQKVNNYNAEVTLEYISKDFAEYPLILKRIEINLTPYNNYQYVKISNIQSNVVKK